MHGCDEAACGCLIERCDLADIGAADKGPVTGTRHDREPQLRLSGKPAGSLDDLGHQRPIEAVQLAGVVDRHMHEVAPFGPLLAANQHAHRANWFDCSRSRPAQASCRHLSITVPARKAVIPALSCGGLTVLTSKATKSSSARPSRIARPSLALSPPQVGVATPGATEGSNTSISKHR